MMHIDGTFTHLDSPYCLTEPTTAHAKGMQYAGLHAWAAWPSVVRYVVPPVVPSGNAAGVHCPNTVG
jgi:hypothetical protein